MTAKLPAKALPTPQSRRKLEAIMAAGRNLFRAHGYGETSMDMVALEAGVSKATLYAYFPGKRELFGAVVRAECRRHDDALLEAVAAPGESLQATLLRLGRAVLGQLTDAEMIVPYRMVVAEAARCPELGKLFYEGAVANLHARLERFLAGEMRAGRLRTGPPRLVAAQFIGLVRGDLMMRAVLCVDAGVGEREKQATVRVGVGAFLRAWGPAGGAGT